jgi:hypothetical protein
MGARSRGDCKLRSIGKLKPFSQASALPSSRRGLGRFRPAGPVTQLGVRRRLSQPTTSLHTNRRRLWVVHLWEAFLLQMDDFDRLLEFQLRRKLDGVVAAPVPARRGRAGSGRPTGERHEAVIPRSISIIPIELRADAFVFLEHS